jgi:hypothetical protein
MRSEHRVAKEPNAIPTLAEAGIDKNLAHRARSAAAVPAEKFEQVIKEGRERITAVSDRVSTKLIKANSPMQRPNGRGHDSSSLKVVDDQDAPSIHAQCVSVADLRSSWDDGCVTTAVGRVIGVASYAPDAPKLPAPQETKQLAVTLPDWIEQLKPETVITRKDPRPAEPVLLAVLNDFICKLEAIDLHEDPCSKGPEEIHRVKMTLSRVYDSLGAILAYLAHDKAEAA